MEETEFSETSKYKIQKPGHHPKERIQHSEQGESLKSGIQRNLFRSVKTYKGTNAKLIYLI